MGSAVRLNKGTLLNAFEPLYQVPNNRVVILKSIILTNLSETAQNVSLKMAGAYVMRDKVLSAGESYQASVFDQIIVSQEIIEGKASQPEAVDCYISGKLLLPQDIASETQWMQEQWDAWWANHPEVYKNLWDAWLESKTGEPNGDFYVEWKEWFDRIQEITNETADLVPWSLFRQHEADFSAHGDLANTYRSGKDEKGIFTTIEWHRQDGTLAKKSVLSGGNSPRYTNRTVTYYGTDGETVDGVAVYKQKYNEVGDWIEEVITDE
ncbi:hypothetical protein [Maledivibacter halophilus]|uniref:Uncharacterized protein n=1 Tax=Maledivibacter halophilus TaxID=36842 RepID=A0A1T5KGK3_9FIRM|nr:hypothetical protein [Maledivibacter halophilus]SKC62585.1 hypothetical protein SAMN02194393_01767 [Maledivibacter halophilus]